jgi:hypothetical protein
MPSHHYVRSDRDNGNNNPYKPQHSTTKAVVRETNVVIVHAHAYNIAVYSVYCQVCFDDLVSNCKNAQRKNQW